MKIEEVKRNLGKTVRLTLPRHYVDKDYVLTGCMIRKSPNGEFFYQAELKDTSAPKSVIIVSLDNVSVKK